MDKESNPIRGNINNTLNNYLVSVFYQYPETDEVRYENIPIACGSGIKAIEMARSDFQEYLFRDKYEDELEGTVYSDPDLWSPKILECHIYPNGDADASKRAEKLNRERRLQKAAQERQRIKKNLQQEQEAEELKVFKKFKTSVQKQFGKAINLENKRKLSELSNCPSEQFVNGLTSFEDLTNFTDWLLQEYGINIIPLKDRFVLKHFEIDINHPKIENDIPITEMLDQVGKTNTGLRGVMRKYYERQLPRYASQFQYYKASEISSIKGIGKRTMQQIHAFLISNGFKTMKDYSIWLENQ